MADKYSVELKGPEGPDKRRIWRVLQLLQNPGEWEDDPPSVDLVWVTDDGKREVIEHEDA